MTQAELALPPAPPLRDDPVGFQIGWDHAHHGLVPPPELLLEGTPIGQGWRAARAVFGARSWPAHRCTRQWLALRIEAWRCGADFDLQTVTPNLLAQIEVRRCPVLRMPLGGAESSPGAPRISRLNPQAAYAAGNLVMLSRAADQAWQGLGVLDLVRCARAAEALQLAATSPLASAAKGRASTAAEAADAPRAAAAPHLDPADHGAWWRLATLRSLTTPMHGADAARLPLAATPPNRTRVLNTVQALQALLTARLAGERWAAEMAAVASMLPEHSQRTDFNLWVGALAPRVLEAQARGRSIGLALEDAWLAERVQRRWQHFALALGTAGCEQLVQRLCGRQPGGRVAIVLADAQATETWALPGAQPPAGPALPPVSGMPAGALGAGRPQLRLTSPVRAAGRRRTARPPCGPRPRETGGRPPAAT
ncbi:MAG: hypothetical protein JNJ89_12645 [Rubrivivax sp.]|nr:hypothetical protein [Rubrivivax sp.]